MAGLLFVGLAISYTREPRVRITYKDYGNTITVPPKEVQGTVICNSFQEKGLLSFERDYDVLPPDVPQRDSGSSFATGAEQQVQQAQHETAAAARDAADRACAGPVHLMSTLVVWFLGALLVTGTALLLMSLTGVGRWVMKSRRTS